MDLFRTRNHRYLVQPNPSFFSIQRYFPSFRQPPPIYPFTSHLPSFSGGIFLGHVVNLTLGHKLYHFQFRELPLPPRVKYSERPRERGIFGSLCWLVNSTREWSEIPAEAWRCFLPIWEICQRYQASRKQLGPASPSDSYPSERV